MKTPLLILTPPEYLNAPKPNLYDAYNHLMTDDVATARVTMAQFYNQGVSNPRARMYETAIELKNMFTVGTHAAAKLPQPLRKQYVQQHLQVMNEIITCKHPMVTRAKETLKSSFKTIYPSQKTQSFSMFILEKTIVPKLAKFKFLAGLIGKIK